MENFNSPSVRELLDSRADIYGDSVFIKFLRNGQVEDRSFKRVRSDSLAVCRWIRHLSRDRMHIAIISKSNYEYITCLTGILISGNIVIPLNPDITAGEAVELCQRADVDIILYEDEFSKKIPDFKKLYPGIKDCINLGDYKKFEEIYSAYSDESEFAELSDVTVDPDACSVIIFTSGTAGIKKGVMLSGKALVGNIMYKDYCSDIFVKNSVAMSVLPMYHIYCFTGDYLKNLKDGLQVCLNGSIRELNANLLLFEPTVMRVVPMIAQTLLNRVKAKRARHPEMSVEDAVASIFGRNIKWLISGGAHLNPDLINEYEKLGIKLRQGYGMTEAGCRISVPGDGVSNSSVGRIIDICKVRIEDGEIQVKTPTAMLGYYNMPEESAEMFTPDGWLKTGDIGYVGENNELFVTGRVKNLIILSNGENVSPEAIEKKIMQSELVEEVLVFAENDLIIAEIYPNCTGAQNLGLDNDELKKKLEDLINTINEDAKSAHIISEVRLREEPFEKNGTGKIKRF